MLGLHTTTAARCADPTQKIENVASDYDKTTSFTLAASLCLLTGVIVTPIVYAVYHWVNSAILKNLVLPFAKQGAEACIEKKADGSRELKVGKIVYSETIEKSFPVIITKEAGTQHAVTLQEDLLKQVTDITQEIQQKQNGGQITGQINGTREESSFWQEVADWFSHLLGLNPQLKIKQHMYLEDIQANFTRMVRRVEIAEEAKKANRACLGDTSKFNAPKIKKELAKIYFIYADFKAVFESDDTFGMDDRLDGCINYLKSNPENLKAIQKIFSDDDNDKKLKFYLTSCKRSAKNSYQKDDDEKGNYFSNLSSGVTTLQAAMKYIEREEKLISGS